MNLNQPNLSLFDSERRKNNHIPAAGSNSFYNIGNGEINLYTVNSEDPMFEISTNKGVIETGENFSVSIDNSYRKLTVITNTTLNVTGGPNLDNLNRLTISGYGNEDGTIMEVHGLFELKPFSELFIRDNAKVILYSDSVFKINNYTSIIVERGSELIIYGEIDVHLARVDTILNAKNITIDSSAVMNVEGIDKSNRTYSLSDYEADLRDRIINIHTQGESNSLYGRMGYTWTGGDPKIYSQVIMLSLLWGEGILGDFKLSALGLPKNNIPNYQCVSDIKVAKDATLYIQEEYKGKKYIRPELYLGLIINNNTRPGNLIIDGTVVCDGPSTSITVDRGAAVYINRTGVLILHDRATMKSTHNGDTERILFIDGTLIIDDTSQIDTFTADNIVFGENGKVVILNPDTGTRKILFSTPNGIHDTVLYKLFKDTIDHIEYHISNNTGIAIDEYFEYYSRDMTKWFGERRIEKAIHDGILVWHDGGFIELNNEIIPWADERSTLYHATRLFKAFASFDEERLQEVSERLKYAGCGNIVFKFIRGNRSAEVTLTLDGVKMKSVINKPMSNIYKLETDGPGELFIKNKLGNADPAHIIVDTARQIPIEENKVEFPLT